MSIRRSFTPSLIMPWEQATATRHLWVATIRGRCAPCGCPTSRMPGNRGGAGASSSFPAPHEHDYLGVVPVSIDEANGCLTCHTTTARSVREGSGPESTDRGIGCERCHGPGGLHIAAINSRFSDPMIASPAKSPGSDQSTLCNLPQSAFHRDARIVHRSGLDRFPSSSLSWSRCSTESGGALNCVTCHDPHRDAETSPSHYDQKCLTCHPPLLRTSQPLPRRPMSGRLGRLVRSTQRETVCDATCRRSGMKTFTPGSPITTSESIDPRVPLAPRNPPRPFFNRGNIDPFGTAGDVSYHVAAQVHNRTSSAGVDALPRGDDRRYRPPGP